MVPYVIGAIPLLIWVTLFFVALVAIVVSVQNAVVSLLYLAGRRGNDDLITRDTYLARKVETVAAAEGSVADAGRA